MDTIALAKRALSHLDKKAADRDSDVLRPYFDSLADDAVLRYGFVREGTPISGEFRGKQAIIDFATKTAPQLSEGHQLDRSLEFIGNGDRVVVLGSESYTISKTGVTESNSEFALVLDFRDGKISKIVQIKDLVHFGDAYHNS